MVGCVVIDGNTETMVISINSVASVPVVTKSSGVPTFYVGRDRLV